MIPALILACALHEPACHSDDARAIASAIDHATDDDRLRAVLVVYAWSESSWMRNPHPWSWDARAGIAHGPWQLWGASGLATLDEQARTWLRLVQRGGLAALDSSPSRATHRAQRAERLLRAAS